jgi:hypothetical protein
VATIAAATARRVAEHTSEEVNRAIRERTAAHVAYLAEHREQIPRRLGELDREWDVERALATASSCFSLLGLAVGLAGRRRWLYLPVVVQGFYLQHTLQGWCPPLPVFRRLGFRTPDEIGEERCALEAIAGKGRTEDVAAGPATRETAT